MTSLLNIAAVREVLDTASLTVPTFVFGTLRVGEGNFSWSKGAVDHHLQNCTTQGRLYYVSRPRGGYPVTNFEKVGTIVGDILWYNIEHPDTEHVFRMEIGAGYEPVLIDVYPPNFKDMEVPTTERCVAFAYTRPRSAYGDRIKGGDWLKRYEDD